MYRAARVMVLACVLATVSGCASGVSESVTAKALTVEGSQARTFDVLEKRARVGDGEAMFLLGVAHERGELGLEPDAVQAAWHYERAVGLGSARARVMLAQLLSLGRGVEADTEAAFRHFLAAAVQGLSVAQAAVGAMYAEGRGTTRDDVEAYAWLAVVSARRDAEVLPALQEAAEHMWERLEADMTFSERPRARALAGRYFEAFGGVQPAGTVVPAMAMDPMLMERDLVLGGVMYGAPVPGELSGGH